MRDINWPPGDHDGPMVCMKPLGGSAIKMPLLGNLTWSDGHNFSSIDAIDSMIGKAKAGVDLVSAAKQSNSKVKDFINTDMASRLAVGGAFGEGAQRNAASLQGDTPLGSIINPQTKTLFSGSAVRTFTFPFVLVPRSRQETDTIMEIHNTIRKLSYPKAVEGTNNMILDFPTTWEISFFAGSMRMDAPVIMPCYLTGFETTYNPTATIWRFNGDPVEIALSVSFTETRPPTRSDL